jgi:hypothetical protein
MPHLNFVIKGVADLRFCVVIEFLWVVKKYLAGTMRVQFIFLGVDMKTFLILSRVIQSPVLWNRYFLMICSEGQSKVLLIAYNIISINN